MGFLMKDNKLRGLKNSMDFRFYDFDDFLKREK
jgi:hypothetical protein